MYFWLYNLINYVKRHSLFFINLYSNIKWRKYVNICLVIKLIDIAYKYGYGVIKYTLGFSKNVTSRLRTLPNDDRHLHNVRRVTTLAD